MAQDMAASGASPESGTHSVYVQVGRLKPDELGGLSSKIELICNCGWKRCCGYNLTVDELASFAKRHTDEMVKT